MNKKKFPKKIYLLNHKNLEAVYLTDWCEDNIFEDDVVYIRADQLDKFKGFNLKFWLMKCKNKNYVKNILTCAENRYKELMKND